MASVLHVRHRLVVERILKRDLIRQQLIVESGVIECLRRAQSLVQHVPEILDRSRQDSGTAGGTDDQVERRVGKMLDNGGGDGREGTLPGTDVVGRGWDVAKGVGRTGNGKVVHFVVANDSRFGDHELRAKEEIDRGGQADGHTGGIRRHDMRCSRPECGFRSSATRKRGHLKDSRFKTFKPFRIVIGHGKSMRI